MIFFSSIENCLVMHHLLNDQICTMVISCHKLDDQVYGIERVVIYRQSLTAESLKNFSRHDNILFGQSFKIHLDLRIIIFTKRRKCNDKLL